MSEPTVPQHARVVVIGGGIIGCSVAYHLALLGCSDVVLLERHRLTAGTTWHSAGLMVTFGSLSETSTELRKYTRDLYTRLEQEAGQATGFRPVGFIEVASHPDRLEEYRRVATFNRYCGVDVEEISPSEVKRLFPLARTDDLLAGFYVPGDGRVDPVDVTMALAKGARARGVRIVEGVAVTGITQRGGAVSGVRTSHGDVQAELVINCAGAWARQVGLLAGATVPLQAAEHYYLLTEPIPGVSKSWPVLEDPSSYGYFREEGGGLMVGLFEPLCAPFRVEGMPDDFAFGEIAPDWERMAPYLEQAMRRVPVTLETGVRKLFCGPESFTPDLAPCLGESPELRNFFVAAGLNSIGVLTGGGVGRLMAHWMLTGRPDMDVTALHVDRLHPYQATPDYRRQRTTEALGLVYACHYPLRTMQSARGAKRSPLHDRLAARGAFFRDVSGWEGADWYAPPGTRPEPGPLSFGRPSWFAEWRAEHEAARQGVVFIDMSFMSKWLVQGRDAGRALDFLSAGPVNGPTERVTYTQWLNSGGTLEADLTVTKLQEDRFLVVASDTVQRHVQTWLERHIPEGAYAFCTDVSSGYAQLNVQGPRSRELLQSLTSTDLSNQAFPFRTAREIDLGFARVLLQRITYVGELGYELFVPSEQALHVYERLLQAGEAFGLRHAGLKALSSLRLEKGYRDYGHDIDNTDTVLDAGLGFAVAWDKPGGFLGREAALAQKNRGPLTRRLVQVLLTDAEPMLFHGEVVLRDGKALGYVRSGSYGFTLGGAVGLAMIDAGVPLTQEWLDQGAWEVDIAGRRVPARLSLQPLYDPSHTRVRA